MDGVQLLPSKMQALSSDLMDTESMDGLTSRTVDDLVNRKSPAGNITDHNPSDVVSPDVLFSREYLRSLSDSDDDADKFLSQLNNSLPDPPPADSSADPPADCPAARPADRDEHEAPINVESLLKKIGSSDNDYFNTHRPKTRNSGAMKLKDTTNIRKSTDSNAKKPNNKYQFHNKIDQTFIDPSERPSNDLLNLFNRDWLWSSPDTLEDQIIQDQDLNNLINGEEISAAKEMAEKAKSDQSCAPVSVDHRCDSMKSNYDLDQSSSDEMTMHYNEQLLDLPADEDSMPLPNVDHIKNDLLMSDDSDADLRESFKEKLKEDVSSLRDVYRVERLLAKRLRKSGRSEYLVKYENLDDDQACWEPEKNLDPKIVEEFNRKYGDKLLLKDLDKQTYSKYFDKRIHDSGSKAPPNKTKTRELTDLIKHSLDQPLCNIYQQAQPERIVGVYPYEGKFYFLVKWERVPKADLFECAKFEERWPQVVIDYYKSKIMFCELQENRQSAELTAKRRVNLHQQPESKQPQ